LILDAALLVIAIIAIATGYNRGALATLFSILGYFGGGVAGFALANWYSQGWKGLPSIIFLHLFAIFAGANLGRWILEKSGIGIHKRISFGLFKFINAILGSCLSLLQLAIFSYVIITLIKYLPWSLPESLIGSSQIYRQLAEFNLFSLQVSDLLKSTSLRWDQLRS
jgi:uncharacterized membrane protein required for colicin V production